MKRRKIYCIILSIVLLIVTGKVEASIEAKPGVTSLVKQTANQFFEKIRQMEATGGTLGLNAIIEETTYLDSSKNGVDVHMTKNTEWGTAAMLAASSYGTVINGVSDESTTQNKTGIFQMADKTYEYVAGIYNSTNSYMDKIRSADGRYYNLYDGEVSIAGDATVEVKRWRNSSYSSFVTLTRNVFNRSMLALFGYNNDYGNVDSSETSRACLVRG